MNRLIASILFAVVATVFATSGAQAAEKAATAKLPASLQALGAAQDQVVTKEQAQQVRGQAYYVSLSGMVYSSYSGVIQTSGWVNYFYMYSDPYIFSIVSY